MNSCSETASVIVTLKNGPLTAVWDEYHFCRGSSITLGSLYTAHSTGVSYKWTPSIGLDNPSSGNPRAIVDTITTYFLTATENGCSTKDSLKIVIEKTPVINAGPDLTICNGNSVQIQAISDGDYRYVWQPALNLSSQTELQPIASPIVKMTYTVIAISEPGNGCHSSDTVVVSVASCVNLITVLDITQDTTGVKIDNKVGLPVLDSCFLDYNIPLDSFKIASFIDMGDSLKLKWEFYQNPNIYKIETSISKTALKDGTNQIMLPIHCSHDKSLKNNTFAALLMLLTTDLKEQKESKIRIFPNPTSNSITVEILNAMKTECIFELYTIDSRKLLQQQTTSKTNIIDLTSYPQGIYILKSITQEGVSTQRIIKN